MKAEGMVLPQVKCIVCEELKTTEKPLTADQMHAVLYRTDHIQNILPEHSAADRELLISGVCGTCFDEMWGTEDDEPEVDA